MLDISDRFTDAVNSHSQKSNERTTRCTRRVCAISGNIANALTVSSPLAAGNPLASPTDELGEASFPHDHVTVSPARSATPISAQEDSTKDLAFLLEPSLYHPVSQLEIPPPFRISFPTPVKEESLQVSLQRLDEILSSGKFVQAAYWTATILSSGKIKSTDIDTIFHLLQLRYSCLELTGNTGLAAQEAKALEDLNSAFYFSTKEDGSEEHIMPYAIRLQALRLQSLGFSDPRRGISSLYDLGLECREKMILASTTDEEMEIWRSRLEDIGVRVVNSLIEMGDLETARRTLISQLLDENGTKLGSEACHRAAMLYIKIGDIESAKHLLQDRGEGNSGILDALISVSEGNWEDAAEKWQTLLEGCEGSSEEAVIKQNLAVALLYIGRLPEVSLHKDVLDPKHRIDSSQARRMMEDLIQDGHGFQSLTFNLATLYELSVANPFGSKRQLAERVSHQSGRLDRNWGRSNADFKL